MPALSTHSFFVPELHHGCWLQAMRMMPPPVRDELVMAMNVDFTLIDARDEEQLSWISHLRVRSRLPRCCSLHIKQLDLQNS